MIVGIDEVGRGPLAGPVYAAAVGLKQGCTMPDGVKDSKKLSPKKRNMLSDRIYDQCHVGVGWASVDEIDALNILQATLLAMVRAFEILAQQEDSIEKVLIDGCHIPPGIYYPAQAIVGGDSHIPQISAASIVAKVRRDALMEGLHDLFPVYAFNCNKGYGTATHLNALAIHGPCVHHRKSFTLK